MQKEKKPVSLYVPDEAVKNINFIKSQPLNEYLFNILCVSMHP